MITSESSSSTSSAGSPSPPSGNSKPTFALGLRGRLILLILATFIFIFAMIVQHIIAHRGEEIANATKHLLDKTKLIAAQQQQIATRADAILSGLVTHGTLQSGAPVEACTRYLAALAEQYPAFLQIGKALPNGDLACSAVPTTGHVNYADRDWFQQAQKSETMLVSGLLTSRSVNQPVVVFARSMRDGAGRVTGVLYLSVDLNWIQQELATTRLPENTHLVVIDSSRRLVVHHPDNFYTSKNIAQIPLFQAIVDHGGLGTTERVGLDGIQRIAAFTPLQDTVSGPMTLWLSVPKEQIMAPIKQEYTLTLTVGSALLLLVMALVYWGGEIMLMRPLRTLCLAVDRFGKGDRTARSGLRHSDDDIGLLARAFDGMAESIQTSEERFRRVAEASLDALFILKSVRGEHDDILDFEFTYLNPRGEDLLGMAYGEVVGQKLCELIPIYRTGGFFDKYVAVMNTGTPIEEEFPIDTPEIRAKWLRHQVVRVGDGIAISSRDVTQWKATTSEIRKQSKLRTTILETVGDGIFGLDLEGRITFINPAGAEILQGTAEEFIGENAHALCHHARADGTPYPAVACPIYAAYRDGEVHRVNDEVFWRMDGTQFPVEYISTPIRDDQGELSGAVVRFTDISERKATEQTLARAARALKTLSKANLLLVNATDEEQLLQDVCRIIVEIGGYRMAWIGYADDNPEKTITPKTWAGENQGYLAQLNLSWDETERGQGPTGRAIRSGEVQVVRDITDPTISLWLELVKAHGYASVLSIPLSVAGRVIGALGIYSAETDAFDEEELQMLSELGSDLAFGIETLRTRIERDHIAYAHAHHAEILQKSLEQSIQAIADTVEARDPYTAGHERRVGGLAVAIAQELGLPEDNIHGIRLAASVHDLGKIQVPAEILSKPSKLTAIEFELIKTHPQAGYDIIKDVDFPWPIADMVYQHHEKLDGSGYPLGLKGDEILLESRIMTVADVVEAMSSHRPYRAALGIEVALKEIERGRGSIYDATAADACLKLFREERFSFQK